MWNIYCISVSCLCFSIESFLVFWRDVCFAVILHLWTVENVRCVLANGWFWKISISDVTCTWLPPVKLWLYGGIDTYMYVLLWGGGDVGGCVSSSICLSVCQQLYVKTAERIFMKISPKMLYLRTRKIALNFRMKIWKLKTLPYCLSFTTANGHTPLLPRPASVRRYL